MKDEEFQKIKNKRNLIDAAIVLSPALLMAAFFNYHRSVVDLTGTYDFVCGIASNTSGLHYVVPKLAAHCEIIPYAERYGLQFILKRDLLLLLDMIILLLPFLFAPYMILTHRTHRMILTRYLERHERQANSCVLCEIGVFVVLIGLLSWIVLFAPATFEKPSGPFVIMDLMADFGVGVFFHSLAASCLPHLISLSLAYFLLLRKQKKTT